MTTTLPLSLVKLLYVEVLAKLRELEKNMEEEEVASAAVDLEADAEALKRAIANFGRVTTQDSSAVRKVRHQ